MPFLSFQQFVTFANKLERFQKLFCETQLFQEAYKLDAMDLVKQKPSDLLSGYKRSDLRLKFQQPLFPC
jgi:hypothetical protein